MSVVVEITPNPVVVGQPWHVVVSGLRPGQDRIHLGVVTAGFDDPFLTNSYFTADANGVVEADPAALTHFEPGFPDGWDDCTLNVFQASGGSGPNSPPKSKLLGSQAFKMTVE